MAGTQTKAVLRWGFLALFVWTMLPDITADAQSACACYAAWVQYKNCTAAIVNRGGVDVSSCVAPSCALGDCGAGGSTSLPGSSGGTGTPLSGAAGVTSAAEQALQGMAGSAAQNGANAINAIQQATQGLRSNSGTVPASQGYNPISNLGRADLEDDDGSLCNCYVPLSKVTTPCDCSTSGAIGSAYTATSGANPSGGQAVANPPNQPSSNPPDTASENPSGPPPDCPTAQLDWSTHTWTCNGNPDTTGASPPAQTGSDSPDQPTQDTGQSNQGTDQSEPDSTE